MDITQLIQIELNLVVQQDTLAQAQGEIPTGLIQTYKALGGGWELRIDGCDPNEPLPPPRPVTATTPSQPPPNR